MTRSLTELLAGLVTVAPAQEREIAGLAVDARQVVSGGLFFALAGSRSHGRHYLGQAVAAGASAVIFELASDAGLNAEEQQMLDESHVAHFCLASLKQQVGVIAERFYANPSQAMTMIGVTGTNGKTSCAQFIAQALHQQTPCGVLGTLGNGLFGAMHPATHTTPDAVSLHAELDTMRQQGARSVVMEVSSHGLDQGRVAGVHFDIAVFTNLTRDHLDYHGDMVNYGATKQRLFHMPGLRQAVINLDDPFGRELFASLPASVNGVGYGMDVTTGAAVVGTALELTDTGLSLSVSYAGQIARLHSPLLGRFNASNLLAALAVLLAMGVTLEDAVNRLGQCKSVAGRMEQYGGGARPVVVVDYAHTPDALEQVLSALREHCSGQLGCVFGCGGNRDAGKRPMMGEVAARLADWVIITDDNPRLEDGQHIVDQILQGITERDHVQVLRDRALAIEAAVSRSRPGDLVLVAGKGHEDYQIIGEQTLPFSDSEQVKQQLGNM